MKFTLKLIIVNLTEFLLIHTSGLLATWPEFWSSLAILTLKIPIETIFCDTLYKFLFVVTRPCINVYIFFVTPYILSQVYSVNKLDEAGEDRAALAVC